MAKTASKIIKKAQSFLGVKENPAGSNNVQFNTDYYGKKVSGSAYPWCCAFVWDIFRLCNMSDLFYDEKKTAYCPTVESWGKQKKLTVDKNKGKKGDLVLFDFSGKGIAQHIGIIETNNGNGTYTCIEGNTSLTSNDNGGKVMRRSRNVSTIRCIIRPQYEKEVKASGTLNKKSNETIAKEVIAGKWGNAVERKKKLQLAGYNYTTIQKIVNKLLKK